MRLPPSKAPPAPLRGSPRDLRRAGRLATLVAPVRHARLRASCSCRFRRTARLRLADRQQPSTSRRSPVATAHATQCRLALLAQGAVRVSTYLDSRDACEPRRDTACRFAAEPATNGSAILALTGR